MYGCVWSFGIDRIIEEVYVDGKEVSFKKGVLGNFGVRVIDTIVTFYWV